MPDTVDASTGDNCQDSHNTRSPPGQGGCSGGDVKTSYRGKPSNAYNDPAIELDCLKNKKNIHVQSDASVHSLNQNDNPKMHASESNTLHDRNFGKGRPDVSDNSQNTCQRDSGIENYVGDCGSEFEDHLKSGDASDHEIGHDKDREALNAEQGGDDDEDDGLPIDRGWAWLVLAGAFLNVIVVVGYGRSLGILFVEYLKLFEASATKTTLFMGVMAAFFSIASLFSMNIVLQLLGVRKTVFLGGVITSIAMATGVFATSITFLICTHSILIGIGHSMIHGPAIVLIGQYFKKRRGFATAIAMSGISFGGSIFPPLVRYLVDEYGVKGTMLILTGLTMNLMVGALLFRPLDSFRKRKAKGQVKTIDSKDEWFSSKASNGHQSGNRVRNRRQLSQESDNETQIAEHYMSNPELTSMSMLNIPDAIEDSDLKEKSKTPNDYLKMISSTFDFGLFKNPMFQLVIVTSNFAVLFGLSPLYLFALAQQKGIPATEASFLLTISGAIDFFSRLGVGYVADLKVVKVHRLIAIGVFISGTASLFAVMYNTYALLVVFAVISGIFGSWFNCLIPVLIIEMIGQEHMAKVLGFVAVFHGTTIAVTHPIMGAIRDLAGSYEYCFIYIGVCCYIAVISLLCEPLARRRMKNFNIDLERNEEIQPLENKTDK